MAACKHVWVSFSTNSDHAGRSRDRGALYQLYSEQPLNVNAFTTPGKFPTHHPLWRSSRFAYRSMLKKPELPPSACGHHLLKTNSTPVCTQPYCTTITARWPDYLWRAYMQKFSVTEISAYGKLPLFGKAEFALSTANAESLHVSKSQRISSSRWNCFCNTWYISNTSPIMAVIQICLSFYVKKQRASAFCLRSPFVENESHTCLHSAILYDTASINATSCCAKRTSWCFGNARASGHKSCRSLVQTADRRK